MLEQFQKYKRELQNNLEIINSFLETAEEGYLEINKQNGRACYRKCWYVDKKRNRQKVDASQAARLATKRYFRKLRPVLLKEIDSINNNALSFDDRQKYKVYDELPSEFQYLVDPLYKTALSKTIAWEKAKVVSNNYHNEMKVFPTLREDFVRLSEEQLIANEIYKRREEFSYKYENQLFLQKDNAFVYPDFEILNKKSGEVYYLEHFGMLDKDDYYKKSFVEKIEKYARNGFFLGKNIFFTYSGLGVSLTKYKIEIVLNQMK